MGRAVATMRNPIRDPVPPRSPDYSLMWRRPKLGGHIPASGSYMLCETPERVTVVVGSIKEALTRREKIGYVFDEMDIDRSGLIHRDGLYELAAMRRSLGQVEGVWTKKKNDWLFARIDKNNTGVISRESFIDYYDLLFPQEEGGFSDIVEKFIIVGETIGNRKRRSRDESVDDQIVVDAPLTVADSVITGVFAPWLAPEQAYSSQLTQVSMQLDELDDKYNQLNLSGDIVSPTKFSQKAHGPADSSLWVWEHRPEPLPAFSRPATKQVVVKPKELTRRDKLAIVFDEMDLDATRQIHWHELHDLASTRRALGHVDGKWSDKKNSWLFARIDQNQDGKIDQREFVDYYDKTLPHGEQFERIIESFKIVGRTIKARNFGRRLDS